MTKCVLCNRVDYSGIYVPRFNKQHRHAGRICHDCLMSVDDNLSINAKSDPLGQIKVSAAIFLNPYADLVGLRVIYVAECRLCQTCIASWNEDQQNSSISPREGFTVASYTDHWSMSKTTLITLIKLPHPPIYLLLATLNNLLVIIIMSPTN
jgi:hypothetical protein